MALSVGSNGLRGFDDIAQKEKIDVSAWATHAADAVETNFLRHKLDKMAEARVFLKTLERYHDIFSSAGSILELGGGSCWASYLIKVLYPEAHVVGTDIAPAAIEHHTIWEEVFQSRLDEREPAEAMIPRLTMRPLI